MVLVAFGVGGCPTATVAPVSEDATSDAEPGDVEPGDAEPGDAEPGDAGGDADEPADGASDVLNDAADADGSAEVLEDVASDLASEVGTDAPDVPSADATADADIGPEVGADAVADVPTDAGDDTAEDVPAGDTPDGAGDVPDDLLVDGATDVPADGDTSGPHDASPEIGDTSGPLDVEVLDSSDGDTEANDIADAGCSDDTDCTAGAPCETGTCEPSTGICSYGPAPAGTSCAGSDLCTVGVCDGTGVCTFTPLVCDNGLFCDGVETCDPTSGCVAGAPPCDDGVDCTDDGCDETDDTCSAVANDSNCDDDLCAIYACDATNGCLPTPIDCDDGVPCTTDSCDPTTGCTATPDDSLCDDGNPCTSDTCDGGVYGGCSVTVAPACSCVYQNQFFCGDTAFQVDVLEGDVSWAVDALPNPGYASADCSLNFNDDIDSYDSTVGASYGVARSPGIAIPATSGPKWLFFSSYYDTSDDIDSGWDQFFVVGNPGGLVLGNGSTDDDEQKWTPVSLDISALSGQYAQFEFTFDSVDGIANDGAGWFVDDVCVLVPPAEVCDNSADDDFDGATDCDDSDCVGQPSCP